MTPPDSSKAEVRLPKPPFRRLRAYAFDPSLNVQLDTAVINHVTLKVPWEEIQLGPVGEYLEVVDVDPPSQAFYPPVDLNHPNLLALDGLPPSEGNPQFHQQMVYAVAMNTIHNFEKALGRRIIWSARRYEDGDGQPRKDYVQRLRIYPHALRDANAYYSPKKKALLFGYFLASKVNPGQNLPGAIVFSCLSHDIIAHETTHALLDGLHYRFIEPSNPDVLAFHEAFADVVALFQHFSHPEVLYHQIARTQGDLANQNLLGQLAQQFGQALGGHGALRDALGDIDSDTGKWKLKEPDPTELAQTLEPHARGAILVAALFGTFLTVYKLRIADLLRIATGGSGILPPGEIHPDLVRRLAEEAAKTSSHILRICIRALDYCPPVDITFGDYLRALITADADLVPDDPWGYRIAFIAACRQWGIYPTDVRSLSEESLKWHKNRPVEGLSMAALEGLVDNEGSRIRNLNEIRAVRMRPVIDPDRKIMYELNERVARQLEGWFVDKAKPEFIKAVGLNLDEDAPRSIDRNEKGRPNFRVQSARLSHRTGLSGETTTDLVIIVTQDRRGYLSQKRQAEVDSKEGPDPPPADFIFRGGSTILISLETGNVRYSISKSIESASRLERQRRFLADESDPSLQMTYFGDPKLNVFRDEDTVEPFAVLHQDLDLEEIF